MEYYSALKKNEATPFAATCMALQIFVLSEVSQKEIDKGNMCQLYMESKIRDGGGYLQNRNRLTDIENKCCCKWERIWERYGLGVWVSRGKVLSTGWIENNVQLHSTGD